MTASFTHAAKRRQSTPFSNAAPSRVTSAAVAERVISALQPNDDDATDYARQQERTDVHDAEQRDLIFSMTRTGGDLEGLEDW
jgi:hypothetical protein